MGDAHLSGRDRREGDGSDLVAADPQVVLGC
jgi:hypothetical protein